MYCDWRSLLGVLQFGTVKGEAADWSQFEPVIVAEASRGVNQMSATGSSCVISWNPLNRLCKSDSHASGIFQDPESREKEHFLEDGDAKKLLVTVVRTA